MSDGMNGLQIDSSRCLRMRFNGSGCRRCADTCPKNAITLDTGLVIDSTACSSCLLCTSVCPSGALEAADDFSACLALLSRVPEPVLGCHRTRQHSHAAVGCLAGLSEEHLLSLCYSLATPLQFNLLGCRDCPNEVAIPVLLQRLADLSGAGFTEIGRITAVQSLAELRYRDEVVDRRSFFRSLRTSLVHSAAVVLAPPVEPTGRGTDYGGKRLPARRELLNQIVSRLPVPLQDGARARYDHQLTISSRCTACQSCVAICPTGALVSDANDQQPRFDLSCCTGCGLCLEFCLEGALSLGRAGGASPQEGEGGQ